MNIINKAQCDAANRLSLTILTYGHAKISSAWRGESRNNSFSYLYYVRAGQATIENQLGTITLLPNRWYLIPSGYNFKYRCDEFMEHLYFHIRLSGADMLDIFRHLEVPLILEDEQIPEELFDYARRPVDLKGTLLLKAKIYDSLLRIMEKHGFLIKQDDFTDCVMNAIKFIRSNLSARLTTTEIADSAFVSKSKLTKQFRKELSMSIQEYLYHILLYEATDLLVNDELSIQQISERLGFSDQFYFSRKFKQKYGLSPTAYRKRIKNILPSSD